MSDTYYTSPTLGKLTPKELVGEIELFMNEDKEKEYTLIIGTDSQNFTVHNKVAMVSAIIIHREGVGARYFYKKRIIERKMEFHERIFLEVTESLEISKRLLKILNEKKLVEKFKELEIHIDAGNRGKTKEILTALKGMVLGCGFTCKVKPESCGASKVADKYSKCY